MKVTFWQLWPIRSERNYWLRCKFDWIVIGSKKKFSSGLGYTYEYLCKSFLKVPKEFDIYHMYLLNNHSFFSLSGSFLVLIHIIYFQKLGILLSKVATGRILNCQYNKEFGLRKGAMKLNLMRLLTRLKMWF